MQMPRSRVHYAIAMAVNVDTHGRRSVQASVDVPGSHREVWDALATGPGLACWFFPTDFMAGADGRPQELVCHMGPGADSAARVTAWEPPHSMVVEGDGFVPGGPAVTTEWTVGTARDARAVRHGPQGRASMGRADRRPRPHRGGQR